MIQKETINEYRKWRRKHDTNSQNLVFSLMKIILVKLHRTTNHSEWKLRLRKAIQFFVEAINQFFHSSNNKL